MYSLSSKTNQGLYLILALALGLDLANKLTPEMVDVLKYVGGFFFSVRAVANFKENK